MALRNVECELVNITGEVLSLVVECNNLQSAYPKAVLQAYRNTGKNGWRVKSAKFVGPMAGTRSLAEIESRVMSGKPVSGSELSRFARSPRGAMLVSRMYH